MKRWQGSCIGALLQCEMRFSTSTSQSYASLAGLL